MLTLELKDQEKNGDGKYMQEDKVTQIILMATMKEFLTQDLLVRMQGEYLATITIGAILIYLIHFLTTFMELLKQQI